MPSFLQNLDDEINMSIVKSFIRSLNCEYIMSLNMDVKCRRKSFFKIERYLCIDLTIKEEDYIMDKLLGNDPIALIKGYMDSKQDIVYLLNINN